ncbi:hypothetical protein EJD97_003713 [Solanum chilense]|uniref:Uncharacterized protein n=1 Tax=Solanum chilense TaxID=4083 RepID=A0A6N2CFG4_SOLCI|nr:hypothetical protein EJD97_003713 [Solanum chilense]
MYRWRHILYKYKKHPLPLHPTTPRLPRSPRTFYYYHYTFTNPDPISLLHIPFFIANSQNKLHFFSLFSR